MRKETTIKVALFVFFIFLLGFALPHLTFAQDKDALVPSGCRTGCPCTLCDLYALGQNIIFFLLYIVAMPIAAIGILYGGVMMITSAGNEKKITSGKRAISNAIIGLAIAFLAWLVIQALLQTLAFQIGFGDGLKNWNDPPKCAVATGGEGGKCNTEFPLSPTKNSPIGQTPVTCGNPASCDDGETHNNCPSDCPLTSGTIYTTDADAKSHLSSGITVSSTGNCSNQNQNGCTSLAGIPVKAIDGVNKIYSECSCQVDITGGTETGHQEHGTGKAILDLDAQNANGTPNTNLKNYLVTNGYDFIDEGNHFHVRF